MVRERAIKYLHLKLKTEGGQLLNKEAEVTLFKEIKGCVMVSVVKRMQYSTSRHSAKIYGHPCKYPISWRLPFITVNPVSISGKHCIVKILYGVRLILSSRTVLQ